MENNQNQQFVQLHTNTNGMTLFGADGVMLKVDFYDDCVSIKYLLPVIDEATGKRKYPKENRPSFILTKERCSGWVDLIQTNFLDALAAGKKYAGGPFLNSSNTSLVDVVLNPEYNDISLRYCVNIDENRIPKNVYEFKFEKLVNIENYDVISGDFEVRESHAQFLLFYKALEAFCNNVNLAAVHADKFAKEYHNRQMNKQITEFAYKLGLKPVLYTPKQENTSMSAGNATPFDGAQVTSTNAAPHREVSSLEDMLSN